MRRECYEAKKVKGSADGSLLLSHGHSVRARLAADSSPRRDTSWPPTLQYFSLYHSRALSILGGGRRFLALSQITTL